LNWQLTSQNGTTNAEAQIPIARSRSHAASNAALKAGTARDDRASS